jgi:hypothetical protein
MDAIWLRVGDAGDYQTFDATDDAANHLAEHGVRKITRHIKYGVTADDFHGNNYISAFWGGPDAQPTRELTDAEIDEINVALAE